MKTKLLGLCIAVPLLAMSGMLPAAAATYNYAGPAFVTTFGPYQNHSYSVTGSVTFAVPLPSSLGTMLAPVTETPDSFSFSDGVQTINNMTPLMGTPLFQFTTDNTGAIIWWNVQIPAELPDLQYNRIVTYDFAQQDFDYGHFLVGTDETYGVVVDPVTNGVWTSATSATPLPAALPLFATGLGALGLLSWRRKRKAQAVAV